MALAAQIPALSGHPASMLTAPSLLLGPPFLCMWLLASTPLKQKLRRSELEEPLELNCRTNSYLPQMRK